ncbi:hypothetical protein [Thermomonospora cellulosilytica]|uniref:Uncharacterized protein n=1 Tax=Thermomonospora cellulosilytica TaxID=1411118 RepID=A0A7W3R920_9ACTN|nr:hypothetical protein [Thermomonospora cellulosilytica]MBA9004336.1 hypothetical protein [Thermomonospora cellulosilytica]
MNAHGRRIDREGAEQLLDAVAACARGGPQAGPGRDGSDDPLRRLLLAAAAPGEPADPAGEEAAVRAFREAAAARNSTRASRRRITVRSLLSVKIGVALFTATVGIGWAAVAHDIPLIGDGDSATPTATVSPSASKGSQNGRGLPDPSAPAPTVSPEPQTVRLCRAYIDAAGTDPRAAARDPRFAPLTARAGGPDRIAAFCKSTLKAATRTTPPATGSPSKDPGNAPSRGPSPTVGLPSPSTPGMPAQQPPHPQKAEKPEKTGKPQKTGKNEPYIEDTEDPPGL